MSSSAQQASRLAWASISVNLFLSLLKPGIAYASAGLAVAKWLLGLKVDALLLRESPEGRGPAYVLANAGVQALPTQATSLTTALDEIRRSTPGGREPR